MSCCALSICAVCNPSSVCFDTFCGGSLTGTICTPSICVPVSGFPGGICAGSAPNLDNLPLTNPRCTYGSSALDPITSPDSHGATDTPPCPDNVSFCPTDSRSGMGSGSGAAASQFAARNSCNKYSNVGGLLTRWGTMLTSLLGGKDSCSAPRGSIVTRRTNNASIAPTSFGFLLMALLIGFILWKLAFSQRG